MLEPQRDKEGGKDPPPNKNGLPWDSKRQERRLKKGSAGKRRIKKKKDVRVRRKS